MIWTKTRPTQDGLYWTRECCEQDTQIVHIRMYEGQPEEMTMDTDGSHYEIDEDDTREWYGPLELPA